MRKAITLALALVLALSLLTACGGKGSGSIGNAGGAAENAGADGSQASAAPSASGASGGYGLGSGLLSEGKYEEAVAAFTEAIADAPGSDAAYIGRGDAYARLEKAEEALSDYEAALALRKSEAAYLGAVNAYILMNDFDAALQTAADGAGAVNSETLDAKKAALEKGNAEDSIGREHKATFYGDDGEIIWVHVTEYSGGRATAMTSYDKAGAQADRYEYAYDSNGNCVKSCWYVWDRAGLMPREEKYDGQNRVIEIINYGTGSMATNKSVIEYGADGRKSKDTYWAVIENTADYVYTLYEWTDFGKLSTYRTYDKDGALKGTRVFEYDGKQQHVKETWYKADGSVELSFAYEYDADGNLVRENRYDEDGNPSGTTEY